MISSFTFEAIGTGWGIDVYENLTSNDKKSLLKKIMDRIELFDKTYSRFRSDSLVIKLSQKAGAHTLPEDARQLFSFYQTLYKITDGAVTPLIGNLLSEAGYDANYSLKPRALHKPETWEDVIVYKYPTLTMKKPALLDFGAAGKGYLIDILGKLLEENGHKNYCIDGSGDILYKHIKKQPMRIGLEHPENPKQVIGVATVTNGSLCASAGNRRKWDNFHHIINPHTLSSPTHIAAVWAIAETALIADGLTTCLFFVDAEKLQKYFSFDYVILYADYRIKTSHDFPGEFFYNEVST